MRPDARPGAGRILVAGVGNVFLGDDGFGVEVVQRLQTRPLPAGVQVHDIGIRGVHLAYELLDGCELLVLVDTAETGAAPGTVSVIEPSTTVDLETDARAPGGPDRAPVPPMDAHGLTPDQVFALVRHLGGKLGRALVVACQPADMNPGMGLSEPVLAAVPEAVALVEEIVEKEGASWR